MDIPEKLKQALAAADEAYLAGLSNKGTLNRGKKDLDGMTDVTVIPSDTEIQVQWGDVRCAIREPLGSSGCSCPSTAFCRHRVSAILWLKARLGDSPEPARSPDFQSLRAYPADKLARILGTSKLSALRFRLESGIRPEMDQGAVIRVELPWAGVNVRLLEPLEHSTCACHSTGLCVHKAEALLWWQLHENIITPEQLPLPSAAPTLDTEQLRGICRSVQETLSSLMAWGLGRASPEICQTLERMASLCHTAGLPNLERSLRRLSGEYDACFARSAGFRDTVLLERLSHTYRLAQATEQATEEQLSGLAGEFREEYRNAGNRKLYLLGSRIYSEKNGYAGTIYYFRDMEQQCWYAFRHIRPTFYEGRAQKVPKHASPWGLPCTLDKLWKNSMELTGAKANRHGNLSATSECSAAILGPMAPAAAIPEEEICMDFRALLGRSDPSRSERQRLALIRAAGMEVQPYDSIRQIYTLRLLDSFGRDVWLKVPYSKDNSSVIDWLERLTEGQVPTDRAPVFFGILSRESDRLTFSPIECFTDWEGQL
ncbi:MAG: hypothetical protein IKC09_07930 [Oscillospiraceae bacterium]|nr:hypothetical protein [Oscillospiraceae bacterium]MBR2890186.1 hypothetical protein [Oscillospiraceae bacterium]